MKIKRILTSAFMTMALSSSLMAQVVFDLGAQQFYYCVTDKTNSDGTTVDQFVEASYDVSTAIASTGLISENGYYRPADASSGHFGVQIKEPKANWAVSFNVYAYLYNDGSSIELLGENGKAIVINFDSQSITTEGEVKTDSNFYNNENIAGSIEMQGDNIHIVINGKHVFNVEKPNFKLAKVNIPLFTERSASIEEIDKLNSLTISTSD